MKIYNKFEVINNNINGNNIKHDFSKINKILSRIFLNISIIVLIEILANNL